MLRASRFLAARQAKAVKAATDAAKGAAEEKARPDVSCWSKALLLEGLNRAIHRFY